MKDKNRFMWTVFLGQCSFLKEKCTEASLGRQLREVQKMFEFSNFQV